MAILVAGGAGYIGSHTVYELIEAGYDVAIVDDLSTGYFEAIHPKARFYQGNIADQDFLHAVFHKERIEGVIHFAAYSLVGESMEQPLKYYKNNLCGTQALLEVMAAYHVDKIIFSSTAAVYGEPEQIPIVETEATRPTNCYGETKLAIERMLYWTERGHELRFVSLRYFNACGAHITGEIGEAHQPESHLLPLVLQVAAGQREKILIFGDNYPTPDGTCVRDYIHVTDLAQAHILALKYLRNNGPSDVFNLGNGRGFSVKEVIEAARRVTARPIPTQIVASRPGDPAQLVADSQKARSVLGWEPLYKDLDKIIETAWQWHYKHPRGYGSSHD